MRLIALLVFPWRLLVLGFGGDGGSTSSSSSTSTTTTTQNVDKRQVVDSNSVGVSSDMSTVNVTATDFNSVARSFDLAKTSSEQGKDTINKALGYTGEVLKFAADAAKIVQSSAANVGDAYKTAQDSATGLRFVVAAGMVIAGIVAVTQLPKMKKAT